MTLTASYDGNPCASDQDFSQCINSIEFYPPGRDAFTPPLCPATSRSATASCTFTVPLSSPTDSWLSAVAHFGTQPCCMANNGDAITYYYVQGTTPPPPPPPPPPRPPPPPPPDNNPPPPGGNRLLRWWRRSSAVGRRRRRACDLTEVRCDYIVAESPDSCRVTVRNVQSLAPSFPLGWSLSRATEAGPLTVAVPALSSSTPF